MKKLFTIVFIVLASFASAQFDMMREMKSSPISLVMNPDIKKELRLTRDQSKKIDGIQKEYLKKMQESGKAGRGNDMNAGIAALKGMDEAEDAASKAVMETLNPDQTKRMREIRFQIDGASVLYQEETQKALGLSEEQVGKITEWKNGETDRMMALAEIVQKTRDGKAIQKKFKEMKATEEATLMKVLTPEQTAKLKEMQGAPCAAAKRFKDAGF